MHMKTVGLAIDAWKLPIFKKHLDAAGFKYAAPAQFTEGTLVVKVYCKWLHDVQPILEAANRECAQLRSQNDTGEKHD